MPNELEFLLAIAPALALHMVRAGAFLAVVPTFGSATSSRMLRLVLVLSLGAIMWWTEPTIIARPSGLFELGALAAREALVGVVAGFAVRLLMVILAIAGEIISQEMGFTMSRVMDPDTGVASTSMAQLFEVIGILLIFQLDLHHEMLRVLQHTYELVPVGEGFDFGVVYANLADMVAKAIEGGLRYAIPIFGVMLLLTATLIVLARAVQNINLMEFSFGLRILLALSASIYFMSEGTPFLARVFDDLLLDAHGLFEGA